MHSTSLELQQNEHDHERIYFNINKSSPFVEIGLK